MHATEKPSGSISVVRAAKKNQVVRASNLNAQLFGLLKCQKVRIAHGSIR